MDDEIAHIIRTVPALSGYDGPVERLGGLTNRVYRLGDHVLRMPGAGTEAYINRAHEAEMAKAAARAGVSPQLIHADPASGIMVTAYMHASGDLVSGWLQIPARCCCAGRRGAAPVAQVRRGLSCPV